MASKKRVESRKNQNGQVIINTTVDDPIKSIDKLISEGLRNHVEGSNFLRKFKKTNKPVPSSFNVQPVPKSRTSSVGPSTDGSDDGFGSSGRQTMSSNSPSSASFHPYASPNGGIYHQRGISAPSLTNCGGGVDQRARLSQSGLGQNNFAVFSTGNYSLNSTATTPTMTGITSRGSVFNISNQMQSSKVYPYHGRGGESKSADFGSMNSSMTGRAKLCGFNGGVYEVTGLAGYNGPTQCWSQKQINADPLMSVSPSTDLTSPINQRIASPLPGTSDDLPNGWSQGYDNNGTPYYIDHINKRTTWIHPLCSEELEQKVVNNKHQFSYSTGQLHQHGHTQPQVPQNPSRYYHHQQRSQPQTYHSSVPSAEYNYKQNESYRSSSGSGVDMINKLAMERNYMHKRQQQLYRDGLILSDNHYPREQQDPQQQPFVQPGYSHQAYQQPEFMEVDYAVQTIQQASIDPVFSQHSMASKKRVESKKNQAGQAGQVTIKTTIDDAQKSIDHLISEGLRKHKEGHLYNKYKSNKQLPPNFYAKPPPKSRGSSVGHSRESSDDGFSGSGRQTLSPSSISPNTVAGFHPYSNPNPSIVHHRQASAPALINYGVRIDQPHPPQQPASTRGVPGLPPVTHGSLNTVVIPPTVGDLSTAGSAFNISAPVQSPVMGTMPAYHDRESKSLDFDAMNHDMAVKAELFEAVTGSGPEYGDNGQTGYFDTTRYWPEPRHKSLSLDPMTLAQMNTNHTSPVHHPITSPLPGTSDDLPEGWVQGYDVNGEPYFIDHNNRRTTWFDPRMSEELQQKAIKNRHQFSFSTGQIPQPRHIPPQLPQPPPPQQQQYYHHHQHSHPQTTFHTVDTQFTHAQNPSLGGARRDSRGDMVNELAMERNYMLERRQQLYRDGLIADGQRPPVPRQQQQPQFMQPSYPQQVYQQAESMEVDYPGVQPMQHTSIDPAFVQDLNPNDLNPHEFDQYLCIDNNKRPSHNLHNGLAKYPRSEFFKTKKTFLN